MGNVAVCAPLIGSGKSVIRVLTVDGRLIMYSREPVKAGEIMLENPGQFLCESRHLKIGQRIKGICADEHLEAGELYFLLPVEMLYSVLTVEEMKVFKAASKSFKPFSKIFTEFCLFPVEEEDSAVTMMGCCSKVADERFSRQRSWQPALETILETPPRF